MTLCVQLRVEAAEAERDGTDDHDEACLHGDGRNATLLVERCGRGDAREHVIVKN